MKISDAMMIRKSVRSFLPKHIEKEKLDTIFEYARYVPSGVNMQPWDVAIVSGKTKQILEESIQKVFDDGAKSNMDYQYYPKSWFEPYKSRRKETGLLMYKTLNISREDHERQIVQWKANYRAFDAPTVLLFFMDKELATGSFLDYGMFIQSIMLLAVEQGLATCPQAAIAEYPDIVRDVLKINDDKILIAGMAIGYEDKKALINSYRTPRIERETFTKYFV